MTADPWSQDGYRCRLEWGRRGARVAAESGDVLVVIDVLSLSTATVTAVQQCEIVYPCAWADDPGAYAAWIGNQAAVNRREVPEQGRVSLSPPTFTTIEPGPGWCWPRRSAQSAPAATLLIVPRSATVGNFLATRVPGARTSPSSDKAFNLYGMGTFAKLT